MDDIKRSLLGDKEAAKRLTDAGVLLPCPKCKGAAIRTRCSKDWLGVGYETTGYGVFCKKCKISVQFAKSSHEADLDWNTRAPILSAEEMEMLEGME